MHAQAGHELVGQVLRARVCVVGAGPAGLALATRLAGRGVDVVVLEAADPAIPRERLETVRNVGMRYDLPNQRGRGVGGGALLWNLPTPVEGLHLRLREMDAQDFLPRPGVRETAWPLTRPDLDAWYEAAWALFDLPPVRDGATGLSTSGEADGTPAGAPGAAPGASAGEERLFGMGPAAVFTERLPRALEASSTGRVVTGSVVTDIRTDRDLGTVSSLTCATLGGTFTVEAAEFVLAGGAVENARLLLSARSRHTAGIGNASGHVGRWFMEHPHVESALLRPRDQRLVRDRALWDVHLRDGVPVMRMRALPPQVVEREGLLSTAFYLRRRPVTSPVVTTGDGGLDLDTMGALRSVRGSLASRRAPSLSRAQIAHVAAALPGAIRRAGQQALAPDPGRAAPRRRTVPRAMNVWAMSEQVPHWRSQVRLTDQRDSFGVPTAELDWQLTDPDWQSLVRSQQLITPYLGATLGARVDSLLEGSLPPRIYGGAHQMGTTRMAASARDGVVDVDCRVHGMANLYVAGASVFPTVGSANPTLTVVALALRLAEHLRPQHRDQH
ncbi:FAD-dependent oxidoreductase [Cellulomonas aerilata]|uniref:GMC oxidoreductase n=1 Tax=Cellulomonas aerilata TaxID=515326 RepID=A0A512D889_9CELL|nr:FAD-dependent oxidoreductase [Cellulomonas aerilata]GEO32679.1 GMC oxidoreductase [Cellulomonas aerilata]